MAHSQIILPRFLSEFYKPRYYISDEFIYHLSPLKFDGENGVSIAQHCSDFCDFGECYEIDDEGLFCLLLFLTFEGRAKQWCRTLPKASIHSFEQLAHKLQQDFHRYNPHDVVMKLHLIRMEPQESLGELFIRFVHYCFEFPERDVDWKCLGE